MLEISHMYTPIFTITSLQLDEVNMFDLCFLVYLDDGYTHPFPLLLKYNNKAFAMTIYEAAQTLFVV